jgi:hypothetical protein
MAGRSNNLKYFPLLLGRCLPTTYCTIFHGLERMKERNVDPAEENNFMVTAGLEPSISR